MIAGVYGLQAVIFLLKRQWQHIGWMIIYLLAYPVYSFILPLYSFWNQDNFSWGNTRVVIGEKGDKKIVAMDDEGFDPRSIPLQRWDDYALMNGLPGRRSGEEKFMQPYTDDAAVEMDDMRSMYSSVKPASTILTGFPAQGFHHGPYATPPPVGSPYGGLGGNQKMYPGGAQSRLSVPGTFNFDEGRVSPRAPLDHRQSRLTLGNGRPMSTFDMRASRIQGPSDGAITEAIQACLADVDLDSVTKKQVRALVEQRLQTSLTGERKTFLDRQIDIELSRM
ncbi:hypothetical protein KEM56_003710 [Ascosphaera pollenicola]|nr:hypothetical protein KEM56_003710 [Ascosphaera pollenicola]